MKEKERVICLANLFGSGIWGRLVDCESSKKVVSQCWSGFYYYEPKIWMEVVGALKDLAASHYRLLQVSGKLRPVPSFEKFSFLKEKEEEMLKKGILYLQEYEYPLDYDGGNADRKYIKSIGGDNQKKTEVIILRRRGFLLELAYVLGRKFKKWIQRKGG